MVRCSISGASVLKLDDKSSRSNRFSNSVHRPVKVANREVRAKGIDYGKTHRRQQIIELRSLRVSRNKATQNEEDPPHFELVQYFCPKIHFCRSRRRLNRKPEFSFRRFRSEISMLDKHLLLVGVGLFNFNFPEIRQK